jgi:hypothetical protein
MKTVARWLMIAGGALFAIFVISLVVLMAFGDSIFPRATPKQSHAIAEAITYAFVAPAVCFFLAGAILNRVANNKLPNS